MNTIESPQQALAGGAVVAAEAAKGPAPALKRKRRFPAKWVYGLVLVGAAAGTALAIPWLSLGRTKTFAYVVHPVQLGTLAVEVTERGNLESAHNVEHFCEVEGRSGGRGSGTAILRIVPAGTAVKKGDVLVELETSYLEDMIQTQRIAYESSQSGLAKARADVETARKAIKEYEEGLFVRELKTLQADATIAEENLRRARNSLAYTERLYRSAFVNKLELEGAGFAVRNAQLNLDKANTALNILVKVTKEKQLTLLRGDLAAKEAILKSEQERATQEKERLDRMLVQLTKCKIRAKADGMVMYYEVPGRFGPDEEDKIREGAIVRERQKLIILPDLKNMQMRVLVNESKLDGVRKGQPALIRVDAFGDKVLTGRVDIVSTAPEHGPWYDREKRNYPVIVHIDDPIEGLKPGMTAQATILVGRLPDVLSVPVQCVRAVGKDSYCYVLTPDGRVEERRARLGPSNDHFVQIREGLSAGESVIESPEAALGLKAREASGPADNDVPQDAPRAGEKEGGPPPGKGKNKAKGKDDDDDDRGPPPGKGPRAKGKDKDDDDDDRGPPPGKGPRGKAKDDDDDDHGPPPGKGPGAKGKGKDKDDDDDDRGPPPGKGPRGKGKDKDDDDDDRGPPPGKGPRGRR